MAYVDIPTPVHGLVVVYRNGEVNPGYVVSGYAMRYDFDLNDSFGFEAHPDSGYDFVRFCGNASCGYFTNVNPFYGTITATNGTIYAFFRQEPTTKDYVDGEISKVVKSINALGKAVDERLMDMVSYIQEVKSSIADITKFINGIDNWFVTKFESMRNIVIGWIEAAFISILEKVLEHEKQEQEK